MSRPPSKFAHEQVLNAALDLFAARGIDATSMDAIAEASGVSKATIYKHWADKDALCLEALARLHGVDQGAAVQETGDVRADIAALLLQRPHEAQADIKARIMPHLLAYAARNPAFGLAWRAKVLDQPHKALIRLLRRAVTEGELPADLDYDLSAALLLGPMIYGHVLTRFGAKVPEDLAQRAVAAFWKAHSTKTRRSSRHRSSVA